MKNRLFCSRESRPQRISTLRELLILVALGLAALVPSALAGSDAPPWMHALVNAPVPEHDEKTDAVLLYAERNLTVLSADKIKVQVRAAYKILRPSGRDHGDVFVPFSSPGQKITSLHGWCIPAQGKDYEVKDKDAMEIALHAIAGSNLVDDVKDKFLRIPAPEPGNIVGYEYEREEQPLVLQDEWFFQEENPVRESHYSLQLPPGWEFKASWLNYPEVTATGSGNGRWQWSVGDVKGVREERDMPPLRGVLGQMVVSYFPPGGPGEKGFSSWQEMGRWYLNLANSRREASPAVKQEVSVLASSAPTTLGKIKNVASFVQHDIRYVAIELGIGNFQPHAAADVFAHHYGDCKDKATLTSSMLHELGVESYYVVINSERGSVTADTPAYNDAFNHVVLAIQLPDTTSDPSLVSVMPHPKLGKLLFFDPTNEVTPFGQIGGYLQANYGLLVTPEGGELVALPMQPTTMNSVQRTAKLSLDATGGLKGHVSEVRLGDRAWTQRWQLRTATKDIDRIKPIENLLAGSLAEFHIISASLVNAANTDQPFGYEYSFEAPSYAKSAGNLLLVRPRVLGNKSSALLETKEPRKFPIEFDGPVRDSDTFDITLPAGYTVDDLPPAVNAECSFASYHSKSEFSGNIIHYTRTFEVKELSVPVSKAAELKQFYRTIAGDERNAVVLRPVAP